MLYKKEERRRRKQKKNKKGPKVCEALYTFFLFVS